MIAILIYKPQGFIENTAELLLNQLDQYFDADILVFDPAYVLTRLDRSFNESLYDGVQGLQETGTPISMENNAKILGHFAQVLHTPRDLLVVEGFVPDLNALNLWQESMSLHTCHALFNTIGKSTGFELEHVVAYIRNSEQNAANSGLSLQEILQKIKSTFAENGVEILQPSALVE